MIFYFFFGLNQVHFIFLCVQRVELAIRSIENFTLVPMFIVCFHQDLSRVPLSSFAIIRAASLQEVSIYYGVWTPDIWQVFAPLFSTTIFHTICLPHIPCFALLRRIRASGRPGGGRADGKFALFLLNACQSQEQWEV